MRHLKYILFNRQERRGGRKWVSGSSLTTTRNEKPETINLSTLALLAILAVIQIFTGSARADEPGQPAEPPVELYRQAVRAIAAEQYGRAVLLLEQVVEHEANDVEAWTMLGLSWNRMRLHDNALDALTVARQLGGDNPTLSRERGIAYVGLRRYERALEALADDGDRDADAAFARGQAHFQLGQLEQAMDAFERAIALDPRTEPHARMMRTAALATLGRVEEARAEAVRGLAAAEGSVFESPFQAARARLDDWPLPPRPRLFYGSLEAGFRYNDNVMLRPDDATALPPELTDKRDWFGFANLQMHSDLYHSDDTILGVSGTFYNTFHIDFDDFDVADMIVLGRAAKRFGDVQFNLAGGGGYTWLGRRSLRATGLARAGLAWRVDEQWQLAGRYTVRYIDYRRDVSFAEENRTGWYHGLRFGPRLRFEEQRLTASLHALIDLADTRGDSVAYAAYGFELRAAWEPADDWTLIAGTRFRHFDYDNPNVRTGFASTRRDDQWLVFGSIQYRFAPQWTFSVDLQCLHNDSNIPGFFSYDQTMAGMSVRIDW